MDIESFTSTWRNGRQITDIHGIIRNYKMAAAPRNAVISEEYKNAFGDWLKKNLGIQKAQDDEGNRVEEVDRQVNQWHPMPTNCVDIQNAIKQISNEIDRQSVITNSPKQTAGSKRVAQRYITAYTRRIVEFEAEYSRLGCDLEDKKKADAEFRTQLDSISGGSATASKNLKLVLWIVGGLAAAGLTYYLIRKAMTK